MPRPIAASTPLPACAGVGVVRDSAAIAPANAAPLPICPKRLNGVWFVLMAPLHLLQFQVRCVGYWIAQMDHQAGEPAATLPNISGMVSIGERVGLWAASLAY